MSTPHPRVLITGGYGCIGAETARWLVRHVPSALVVVCSRDVSPQRSQEVFGDEATNIHFAAADVTQPQRLLELLQQHQITHVTHLAGLQTPDCNAHRDLGLQINLAGTQHLLEAMKASELPFERFLFASSLAVYGPRKHYPPGRVPMLAEPQPVNVYGTWKLAGEQLARIFATETKVPTISLRPGVLFGPGRDRGLTATPTEALKCVVQGRPFEIPYGNRQDYLYVPDVGAAVGHALIDPFSGYAAFTLPSHTVDTETFVDAARTAAAELDMADQFHITIGGDEVPFVCDIEFAPFLEAFPAAPHTPLKQAIRESLQTFRAQLT